MANEIWSFLNFYLTFEERDRFSNTHLLYAISQKSPITELLLKIPNLEINLGNLHFDFPLYIASFTGQKEIVKTLLSKNANINLTNSVGTSALSIACQWGREEIVKILLENSEIDVNL